MEYPDGMKEELKRFYDFGKSVKESMEQNGQLEELMDDIVTATEILKGEKDNELDD